MITFMTRARIVGDTHEVREWANELGTLVGKIAKVRPEIAVRIGGDAEVIVLTHFEKMADLEEQIETVEADAGYKNLVQSAVANGYFDMTTVEHGIWKSA